MRMKIRTCREVDYSRVLTGPLLIDFRILLRYYLFSIDSLKNDLLSVLSNEWIEEF